jgi:hypothetical protein
LRASGIALGDPVQRAHTIIASYVLSIARDPFLLSGTARDLDRPLSRRGYGVPDRVEDVAVEMDCLWRESSPFAALRVSRC